MKLLMSGMITLFAAAAMPVLAAGPAASIAPPVQLADAGDFASQKSEYEARARHEMDRWQQRMSEAGAQSRQELDRAWVATKEQWADLQQATAEGWDRSRTAFERASDRLKQEWRANHPNDQ